MLHLFSWYCMKYLQTLALVVSGVTNVWLVVYMLLVPLQVACGEKLTVAINKEGNKVFMCGKMGRRRTQFLKVKCQYVATK